MTFGQFPIVSLLVYFVAYVWLYYLNMEKKWPQSSDLMFICYWPWNNRYKLKFYLKKYKKPYFCNVAFVLIIIKCLIRHRFIYGFCYPPQADNCITLSICMIFVHLLFQDVEANTVRLKEHEQSVLVLEKSPRASTLGGIK